MRTHPHADAVARVCAQCGRAFTNPGQRRLRCWRCRQRVTPATPRQTPPCMTLEAAILLVEAQLDVNEGDRWLLQFELETLRKLAALPPNKR